jgi:hypothetical protein
MAETLARSIGRERTSSIRNGPLSAAEFMAKWGHGGSADKLNERAGAQPHFIDLCSLLGVEAPADPDRYCFERGLWGVEGGHRFADVWKQKCFAWEYKAPGGDLRQALAQLMQYALPLHNPPLLIVSDRRRIEIHTHFTDYPSQKIEVPIETFRDPRSLDVLRRAFVNPDHFKPGQDSKALTADLASSFARIADQLRKRGEPPFQAAHFLTQCVFCCFAEDAKLLKNGEFRRVIQAKQEPARIQARLTELFTKMQTGGDFGVDEIPWFNGGLFISVRVPILSREEIKVLSEAADANWHAIDPTIFGTLFERGLDPAKRSQIGAHFTDAATIEKLIDPVIRCPLLAEWEVAKGQISGMLSSRDFLNIRAKDIPSKLPKLKKRYAGLRSQASKSHQKARDQFSKFLERLRNYRVLDPACGSGNFLYLALKALKDIEFQANQDAEQLGLERQFPVTGPQNVLGIELSEYAAELARATIWIGELQWMQGHGLSPDDKPVLKPLNQIECRDALLNPDGSVAQWPLADVILGNPPFLGDKKMRAELGASYTDGLRRTYSGRVPGGADLVCYWFDKAREAISGNQLTAAGLVATNSIRGGKNRAVLDSIFASSRIYAAWSDQPWVNEGAAVRVSLIAFGNSPQQATLDGQEVLAVHSDLTGEKGGMPTLNLTLAQRMHQNTNACFVGTSKKASFDIPGHIARSWIGLPNPNGKGNEEVVKPWINGSDLVRAPSDTWIVDFGVACTEENAALFQEPFEYVARVVRPEKMKVRNEAERKHWWLHARTAPDMRHALAKLPRYAATSIVAKHRIWVWRSVSVLASHAVGVVARSDDATLGILHSRFHELWALRMGTSLEDRPRYTPTTCFETFPFPAGFSPAETAHQRTELLKGGARIPAGIKDSLVEAAAIDVAIAAHRLDSLRAAWLSPPEWTIRVPDVTPLGMRKSPYPDRMEPSPQLSNASLEALQQRTLTKLYNQRPSWLVTAHRQLDKAVARAYDWADYTPIMPDDEILNRLLKLNKSLSVSSNSQA